MLQAEQIKIRVEKQENNLHYKESYFKSQSD